MKLMGARAFKYPKTGEISKFFPWNKHLKGCKLGGTDGICKLKNLTVNSKNTLKADQSRHNILELGV